MEARDAEGDMLSIESLKNYGITKAVIETLQKGGVLEGISESAQITLF